MDCFLMTWLSHEQEIFNFPNFERPISKFPNLPMFNLIKVIKADKDFQIIPDFAEIVLLPQRPFFKELSLTNP